MLILGGWLGLQGPSEADSSFADPVRELPRAAAAEDNDTSRPLRAALGSIQSIDPHRTNDRSTLTLLGNLYETLVSANADGEIGPGLAISWERESPKRWVFRLRSDSRFSNGNKVTAADVAASFERVGRIENSPSIYVLTGIEEIAADGDFRVSITTKRPHPLLIRELEGLAILPRDAPSILDVPLGSGPYQLVKFGKDDREPWVLKARPEHWRWQGKEPSVSTLELWAFKSGKNRFRALMSGQVDLCAGIGHSKIEAVERRDDLWIFSRLGIAVFSLELNLSHPPLDDLRVREAVDLALDREHLVREMLHGYARPAGQIVSPQSGSFHPKLKPSSLDVEGARQRVEAVSAERGGPIVLKMTTNAETSVVRWLVDSWKKVGFEVELTVMPWADMLGKIQAGEPSMYLMGWADSGLDAVALFKNRLHSFDSEAKLGGNNFLRYSDPEIDILIRKAADELEGEARVKAIREIAERFAADKVMLPLYWVMDLYGGTRAVEWEPRIDGEILGWEVGAY